MSAITQILTQVEQGDPRAIEELLPLVYDELRQLAASRIAQEKSGHLLQATALVHDAYLRLAAGSNGQQWNGRAHFFGAAAQAMRRILVDQARQQNAEKRGGKWSRVTLDVDQLGDKSATDEVLEIDDALTKLAVEDPQAVHLIQLRYFAGLSIEEAAEMMGVSRSTAYEHWSYAKVRLRQLLTAD